MRVAFQGEHGAYSEEAIFKHFGKVAEAIPFPTLRSVLDSIMDGKADLGILPVENTIEGGIDQTLDLLLEYPLNILGEEVIRITHCLIANLGVDLRGVGRVYSHPQALGQCRAFLEKNRLEQVSTQDTAGSVRMIRDLKMMDAAAIASHRASEIYGMKILVNNIENDPENYTRFLIIGVGETPPSGDDKTTIAFTGNSESWSIVDALRCFSERDIRIIRLCNRPLVGKPWNYIFYLDFEGHVRLQKVSEALERIRSCSTLLKILGSYPKSRNHH